MASGVLPSSDLAEVKEAPPFSHPSPQAGLREASRRSTAEYFAGAPSWCVEHHKLTVRRLILSLEQQTVVEDVCSIGFNCVCSDTGIDPHYLCTALWNTRMHFLSTETEVVRNCHLVCFALFHLNGEWQELTILTGVKLLQLSYPHHVIAILSNNRC